MADKQGHTDTAMAERSLVGWSFWLLWVLVNTVAFTMVWLSLALLPSVVEFRALGNIVDAAINAAFIGTLQWLVLRRHIPQASWWILASVVGALVGQASKLAVGFEYVVFTGIAEWLVLRRHVHRAGWWILASVVSWRVGPLLGMPVMLVISAMPGGSLLETLRFAIFGGLSGVGFGAITGAVLVWLLRQPVPPRVEQAGSNALR
jgi:hypothetical protein